MIYVLKMSCFCVFSCGLVAVVMASQIIGPKLTTNEVFNAAINKGFTKQGEMFSGNYIAYNLSDFFLLKRHMTYTSHPKFS